MHEMKPTSSDAPRARPIGRLLLWGGLAALLALVGFGLYRTQAGPVSSGPAPEFTLTTFDGETIALADLKGQVIVVNFWASWCKPCEEEAATLESGWQRYRDQGVSFLGVDYVDTEPEARTYLERFAITYANGPDLGTRISQAYRIRGVPETYFIDRQGAIARVKIGPIEMSELQSILEPLVNP
jgi:cytochrome c biogenesis protein CcmG/thiol:disulfide interchange protein DsbE